MYQPSPFAPENTIRAQQAARQLHRASNGALSLRVEPNYTFSILAANGDVVWASTKGLHGVRMVIAALDAITAIAEQQQGAGSVR